MVRIFLPLALVSTVTLVVAMVLGLSIDDPRVPTVAVQTGVQYHFLAALAALCFATLVHAIVLTYFMGTGRWIEETSTAYRLGPVFDEQSKAIKYRTVPAIVVAFLLLLFTGALGAAADPASPMQSSLRIEVEFGRADPASPMQSRGWIGLTPATLHLSVAIFTVLANVAVNYVEFMAVERNGKIIEQVLAEVRRIRLEKGLAV